MQRERQTVWIQIRPDIFGPDPGPNCLQSSKVVTNWERIVYVNANPWIRDHVARMSGLWSCQASSIGAMYENHALFL